MTSPRPDLAKQLHDVTYEYDARVQMIVVHTLGAAVMRAAQEEEQISFEALMALNDDEYAAWKLSLDVDPPPNVSAESNSDKVALMHSALTRRAQQLFMPINGFHLVYAAAGSLQLAAKPSPAADIHHELSAESSDGLELLVRKSSRIGRQPERQELAVSRRDFAVVAQAIGHLKLVTELIALPPGEAPPTITDTPPL